MSAKFNTPNPLLHICRMGMMVLALVLARAEYMPAMEFVHPGINITKAQLDVMKAGYEQGKEPWKSWHDQIANIYRYNVTHGPYEVVTRNPDLNLLEWRADMRAIYNLALIWYMEQDADPIAAKRAAERAIDTLDAWATTQKVGGGKEFGFELGDFYQVIIGAEILKSTYPGWTAANTAHAKWYFGDFWWRATGIGSVYEGPTASIDVRNWTRGAGALMQPANQGMLSLKHAMASAIFCDDEIHFREAVDAFMTSPDCALMDVAPNGQVGDTGRDWGHSAGQVQMILATAEMLWCQNLDPYSAYNNRLRGMVEYLAHRELYGFAKSNKYGVTLTEIPSEPDFINFFPPYPTGWYWTELPENIMDIRVPDEIELTREIYKARGLAMPYADRFVQAIGIRPETQLRTMDVSPQKLAAVKVPAFWQEPATTPMSRPGDLTITHLGGGSGSGSVDAQGTWTLQNGARGSQIDNFQFAYRAVTGDCTVMAKVTSGEGVLVITDRLAATRDATMTEVEVRPGVLSLGWLFGNVGKLASRMSFSGPTVAAPYWLKLTRRGNYVTGYVSVDGVNWACPGNVLHNDDRIIPETLYVGIASDRPEPVTFTNVSVGSTGKSSLAQSPQIIQAIPQSDASVLVSWTPSPSGNDCVFYDVLRYDDKGQQYWLATDVTKTSFVDQSPPSGITFSYRIAANGFAGRNLSRSPQALVGVAPSNLTATGSNNSVTLSWSAPPGITTSYRIKRSTTPGGPYTLIGTTNNTNYTDSSPSNGTTYYYVVSCVANGIESANSPETLSIPSAATGIWASAPASGAWSLGNNWVGNTTPPNGLDLIFNVSATTSLNNDRTNYSPGNILFSSNASAFTISGNALLLNAFIANVGTQRQTFLTPITLTGDSTINTYTGDIVLSATISGDHSLRKLGAANVTLGSANTFTGGTIVKAGVVQIANSQSLGTGTVTLDGGGLTNLAEVTVNNPISIPTSGSIALGALANATITSTITGTGSLTLGGKVNGTSYRRTILLNGNMSGFSGSVTVLPYETAVRFASPTAGGAAATWILSDWSDRTTLEFTTGALSLGALAGTSQINASVAGAKTLVIGEKGIDSDFKGSILDGAGTLSVIKKGAGIQTFSGRNTYSGTTSIAGGTLAINGSLVSPVTVTSAGRLAGSGTITGTVNVDANGVVSPSVGNTITTLTIANGLTLAQNSVLTIGVGHDGTDRIVISGGTYTPPPTGTVRVNVTGTDFCTAGNYVIMAGATGINLNQYTLGTVSANYKAALSVDNNNLMLTLTVPTAPTGLAGTPVNSTISLHWNAPDSSAMSYTIYRADTPTSSLTAIGTTTSLTYTDTTASLGLPYTYAVSASNKSGEGPLSSSITIMPAQSTLWKSTAGTGSWNTGANWVSNTIPTTGQIAIFGPSSITTTLTNDCAPGLSLSRIAFVSDAAAYTMSGNALTITDRILGYSTANQVLNMPLTLSGTFTADINRGRVTLANVLSGTGSLSKTGDAVLVVKGADGTRGANTFSGNTTVKAGAVYVEGNDALSTGTITLDGGRLANNGNNIIFSNPINVPSSGTITVGNFFNFTITSPMSGPGVLAFGGDLDGSFRASLYLRGSTANFTGTAIFAPTNTSIRIANAAMGNANANWIFNNHIWIPVSLECPPPATISFGSFSGNGFITSGGATGTITMSIGAKGLDDVYSGVISNNGTTLALTKVGSGSLLLSAASTYSGPTRVEAGNLIMTGSVLNTASVTVASGATLSGTGILGGTTLLQTGGTLAPGTAQTNGGITLKGLSLAANSTLAFNLDTISDQIDAGGAYIAPTGGKAAINLTLANGVQPGVRLLIRNAPAISSAHFTLAPLPRGYTATLSATNGALALNLALVAPPNGLVATPGKRRILLTWSSVPGAVNYTLSRATGNGAFSVLASNLTTTSYIDSTTVVGTTYTYTVAANMPTSSSNDSNPASAIATAAPTPQGLIATPGDKRVDVSWSATDGALSYRIARATVSGGPYTLLADNITSTAYTDATSQNDTTYYYVVSTNENVDGEHSAEASATPRSNAPDTSKASPACGYGGLVSLLLALAMLLRQRLRQRNT